jgi:hypothetical protein
MNFEKDHSCNKFCNAFELSNDYKNMPSWKDTTSALTSLQPPEVIDVDSTFPDEPEQRSNIYGLLIQ